MAALTRIEAAALALSAITALAVPALVLGSAAGINAAARVAPTAKPIRATGLPDIAAIYHRPLFAPVLSPDSAAPPRDAPELLGVAGRINADAVAFIRASDGSSRTLKPGDSVDGWQLLSLARDAAYFARGRDQVRVTIAGGDAASGDTGADSDTDTDTDQ